MELDAAYLERVYAGVLGKLIGVYLGRPVECWTHQRILATLGEVTGYVHDRLGLPLIVTDDDLAGTFTFLRALEDHGHSPAITPAQIGQTWLNTIVEKRAILWWGGLGLSTEHTAYLRLKRGVSAPASGSIALNGRLVAEQIGAQIFIDGWAMVAPGDPELAADLARRAASVSHDGEAVYAAQVVAAMEALAFVEPDIDRLLNAGRAVIPSTSTIARLIDDLRGWRVAEPDWREARARLEARYGPDRYGGVCHVVPNHGVIILSLLYGGGDFSRSLAVAVTAGWDTDCNAGNVGCLLGIRGGLPGIDARPGWRGPLADRLFLPSADGGRAITDAVGESVRIANMARALRGVPPLAPKDGARFHFSLPGSVQGFRATGGATIKNDAGDGLAIRWEAGLPGRVIRAVTPTFIQPDELDMPGYELLASPALVPGQTIRAVVQASAGSAGPVMCCPVIERYMGDGRLEPVRGPQVALPPGERQDITWRLMDDGQGPIAGVGIEIRPAHGAGGSVTLDRLAWDGPPDMAIPTVQSESWPDHSIWRRAWVDAVDHFNTAWPAPYTLAQNHGTGLAIFGAREWRGYRLSADVTLHLVEAGGIAVCVQGMRRYYALLLCADQAARLVKVRDGARVLAEAPFAWELDTTHSLALETGGGRLRGWIDGGQVFDLLDEDHPLDGGAVALVCEEGHIAADRITIRPAG